MSELKIVSGAIDAPDCIGQGWELVKSDYGLFILITFLMVVITIVCSLIPYAGSIINILISGPLLCGVYKTLLMKQRGEIVSLGNMFDGFQNFLAAFLVTLIPMIPSLIYGIVVGVMMSFTNTSVSTQDVNVMRGFSAFLIISVIVIYLFVLFLQILLFFALPLLAERNLGAVEAMKLSVKAATQNLGGIIFLLILEILISIGGALALCIGVLFVLPIIYAANIIAYKSVFPDTENSLFNEPPQPDYYNGMFGANT